MPASFSIEIEAIDGTTFREIKNCLCLLSETKDVLRVDCPVPAQRLWLYQVYDSNCTDTQVARNEILSM